MFELNWETLLYIIKKLISAAFSDDYRSTIPCNVRYTGRLVSHRFSSHRFLDASCKSERKSSFRKTGPRRASGIASMKRPLRADRRCIDTEICLREKEEKERKKIPTTLE